MADAAARREARRRRILDNCESRLQKISGSTSPIINSSKYLYIKTTNKQTHTLYKIIIKKIY